MYGVGNEKKNITWITIFEQTNFGDIYSRSRHQEFVSFRPSEFDRRLSMLKEDRFSVDLAAIVLAVSVGLTSAES